ncbi:hypothetical protein ACNVD4_12670, partial [Rhizobium sp. BR5]
GTEGFAPEVLFLDLP